MHVECRNWLFCAIRKSLRMRPKSGLCHGVRALPVLRSVRSDILCQVTLGMEEKIAEKGLSKQKKQWIAPLLVPFFGPL